MLVSHVNLYGVKRHLPFSIIGIPEKAYEMVIVKKLFVETMKKGNKKGNNGF